MNNSKIATLLTVEKDHVDLADDNLLSIFIGVDWFWVEFDLKLDYVASTNGVGGDASDLDVEDFEIVSIDDNGGDEIKLSEIEMDVFKSKTKQILMDILTDDDKWKKYV